MKASIGRIVIVKGIQANGSDLHPAIINRANGGEDTRNAPICVNVTVFPDGGQPAPVGSIALYDDRAQAEAAYAADPAHTLVAYWPERE